jgi:hypothetical protein
MKVKPTTPITPMPADVWLPLREAQNVLRQAGYMRADNKVRALADGGALPHRRVNGDRQYSLLGLMAFIDEQQRDPLMYAEMSAARRPIRQIKSPSPVARLLARGIKKRGS